MQHQLLVTQLNLVILVQLSKQLNHCSITRQRQSDTVCVYILTYLLYRNGRGRRTGDPI